MNAFTYLKNVGKSLGYAAVDTFKDINPTTASFIASGKEAGEELFSSVKDFTASAKSANDDPDSLLGLAKSTAKDTIANALSDLKTGKWYNKQRYEDNMSEAVGDMLGMDFESDFDFDFDEDDYDNDSDNTEEDVATRNSKAEISAGRQNTIANIKSMDRVGQKLAGSIGTSNVKAAQYVGEVNKNGFKEMLRLNNKGFAGVMNGMTAMNSNLASLMQLGEPLTQHINNSATFYAKTNQWQDSMLAKMDQLVNHLVPQENTPEARSRHRFGDLFTSEGALDLVAIKDTITSSVKDAISPVTDIFGLMDPKQLAADIKSNPLGKLMSLGMKALLPKDLKTGMKGLDSLLGDFFSGFMTKLRAGKIHSNKDGLAGSIIDFLLTSITPESGYKDKLDTSNYNKGKTDWNGRSEKALTEVIPTYLAEIAAAVTNKPMKLYDYNAGRFKTAANLSKEFNDTKRAYANLGKGDFVNGMQQTAYRFQAANKNKLSNKELRQLQDDLDNFNYQAFTSDNFDFQDLLDAALRDSKLDKKSRPKTDYKKYGIQSQKTYDFMVEYIKQLQKTGQLGQLNRYGGDLERGRAAYGDLMDMEEQGDSSYRSLFNGTFMNKKGKVKDVATVGENKKSTNFLTSATDQYNKNIFFYLQDIRDAAVLFKYNIEKFISPTAVTEASNGAESAILKMPKPLTKTTKNGKYKIPTSNKKIKFKDGKPQPPKDQTNEEEEENQEENTPKKKRGKQKGDFDDLGGYMNEDLETPLSQSDFGDDTEAWNYYVNKLNGTLTEPNAKYDKLIDKLEKKNNIKTQAKGKFQEFTQKYKDKRAKWDKGGKFTRAANKLATRGQEALSQWLYRSVPGAEIIQDYFPELGNGIGNAMSSFKDWLIYGDGEEFGAGSGLLGISGGKSGRGKGKGKPYHQSYKEGSKAQQAQQQADNEELNATVVEDEEENKPSLWETIKSKFKRNKNKDQENTEEQENQENVKKEEDKTKSKIAQTAADYWKAINDNVISQFTDDYKDIGKGKKRDDSKNKAIGNIIDGAMKDAGAAKDSMITGALIGGGAGLFTGSIIGPIAGAAIGAGAGLVSKSKTIQEALFGKEVDDGAGGTERAGGLLGKKISNFITKNTKGFSHGARGAIIGGLGGTLLGSPILGAIAGSTVGFVKNSDQAQQKLFGTMGDNGERKNDGLIKKDLQDKFKSRKLGMITGGIGGAAVSALIGGPLGLAGNIIVGSAIGFAADNENFKKRIFGEKQEDGKRKGGLIGYIKTDVFQPIVGIFDKLGRNIASSIKGHFKKTQKRFRNFLIKHIGNRIKKSKVGRAILGIGDKLANGLKKLNPLTRINKRLTKKSLKRGVGFIDPKTGKWVDAAGRQKMREEMGLGDKSFGAQMDETVAQFDSEKDFDDMQAILKAAQDPRKVFEDRMLKGKKSIRNTLQADTSLDDKKKSKLMKAIAGGDFDKVDKLTEELGITPDNEQFADLANQINLYKDNSNKADNAEENAQDALESLFEARGASDKIKSFLTRKDVDLNEVNIQRMLDTLQGDKKLFLKNQEEAEAKAKEDNEAKANEEAAKELPKISDYLEHIKEVLDKNLGNDSVFEDHLDENGNPVDKKGNPIVKGNRFEGQELEDNPYTGERKKKKGKKKNLKDKINPEGSEEESSEETPVEEPADEESPIGEPAPAGAGWLKLFGGDSGNKPKKGDTKSENGVDYIYNGMTWEKDQESTDTNDAEKREKARSGFMQKVGGFGKGIKNIANKIGNLAEGILGGGKKKKKGLFSKLGDMLLGENGLFGGLLSFFTGGKGGTGIVGKLLGKFNLGGAIAGGVGLGLMAKLLADTLGGKFDSLANKLDKNQGKGESQKGTNSHASYTGTSVKGDDGKMHTVAHDSKGNPVTDKNGDYVDTDGKSIKGSGKHGLKYENSTATSNFSTKVKKGLVRDAASGGELGGIKLIGKTAGHFAKKLPGGGKLVSAAVKGGKNLAADATKTAGKAAVKSGLAETLGSQISRVAEKLGKLPMFKGASAAMADFGDTLTKNATEAMEKGSEAAAQKVGKSMLSAAAFAVQFAMVAWDFSEGFQDASTTLKINNPTFGQKMVCGVLRALKNCIPVIGVLIPDATITDLFIEKVGPALGIDMNDIKKKRKEAQDELNAYNEKNETNYTWQEYNKKVKKKYTFGEKVSNGVKSAASSVKKGIEKLNPFKKKKATKKSEKKKSGSGSLLVGGTSGIGDTLGSIAKGTAIATNPVLRSLYLGKKAVGGIKSAIGNGDDEDSNIGNLSVTSDLELMAKKQVLIKKYYKTGNLAKIWEIKTNDFSSPMAKNIKSSLYLSQLYYSTMGLFTNPIKTIATKSSTVTSETSASSDNSSAANEANSTGSSGGSKSGGFVSKAKNFFSGIKNFFTGGNSGITGVAGGDSGFVSQRDPRYANISYGGSNIGDIGCGPAVASMASGGSLSMNDAISKASGYTSKGGTDLGYFKKVFGGKANIVSGSDVANSLSGGGSGAIVLGRDPSNVSKSDSPFGPRNHYIYAEKGPAGSGTVLVDDPEQNRPRLYPNSILNSAIAGVDLSGGSSNLLGIYGGKSKTKTANVKSSGGTVGDNATADQILDQDLCQFNPITADDLNKFIRHKNPRSTWVGHGDVFIAASQASGYDPRYILAHLVNEAGWVVTSKLARSHNYFGIGAYNSNPSNGMKYSNPDMRSGVTNGAKWIHDKYYVKRKRHTLRQMWTAPYAYSVKNDGSVNFEEAQKIANLMAQMSPGALKKIDTSGVDGSSSSSDSSTGSAAQNLGILGTITSAFANGFAPIFGGTTDSGSSSSSGDSMDGSGIDGTTPAGQGTAKSAVEIAKSQIGYQEKASNNKLNDFHANAGSANYTKYGAFTGANGAAWCASFVSWVMDKVVNGDKKKLNKLLRGNMSASVSGLWSNFKNAKAMTKTPQPGDVIIYKNGSSHTGIVESVNTKNKTFNSIEGNTSGGNGYNADGGQVAEKKGREWNYKTITGFGRPNWNAVSGGGSGLSDSAKALLEDFTGAGSNTAALKAAATTGNNASHAAKASISASPRMTSNLKALTAKTGNTKTEISTSMSKSTALLLKTIITLIEQLVDNTSKVESIYDVLSDYIANGGGSNMSSDQQTAILKAATAYTDRTIGSNSNSDVQNTLSSLRTQVDAVLAS